MDLKGQRLSERLFMSIMWVATIFSAILTFIFDDVAIMAKTFIGGLALSALVCVPSWPYFRRNPLQFVKESKPTDKTT